MKLSRFGCIALVLVSLLIMASCDDLNCNSSSVSRATGVLKPVKDNRTGLCFLHTSLRGGTVTSLSQVDCQLVEPALQPNAAAGQLIIDQLQYGYLPAGRNQLCLAFTADASGNLRSNLAVVPCEPVLQAHTELDLSLNRFRP